MKAQVYSFSTTKPKEIERLNEIKELCKREGERFSEIIVKAVLSYYQEGKYAAK